MNSEHEPWTPESLREVWEWKEAVAREYEGLSAEEMMRRMEESSNASLREFGITLPRLKISPKDDEPHRAAG